MAHQHGHGKSGGHATAQGREQRGAQSNQGQASRVSGSTKDVSPRGGSQNRAYGARENVRAVASQPASKGVSQQPIDRGVARSFERGGGQAKSESDRSRSFAGRTEGLGGPLRSPGDAREEQQGIQDTTGTDVQAGSSELDERSGETSGKLDMGEPKRADIDTGYGRTDDTPVRSERIDDDRLRGDVERGAGGQSEVPPRREQGAIGQRGSEPMKK